MGVYFGIFFDNIDSLVFRASVNDEVFYVRKILMDYRIDAGFNELLSVEDWGDDRDHNPTSLFQRGIIKTDIISCLNLGIVFIFCNCMRVIYVKGW
jgi:hypothetical protein